MENNFDPKKAYDEEINSFQKKFGKYWYCSYLDCYVDSKIDSIKYLEDTNKLYRDEVNLNSIGQKCVKTNNKFNSKLTLDEYHNTYCKYEENLGWIYNLEDNVEDVDEEPYNKELMDEYLLKNGNGWYFDLIDSFVPFIETEVIAFDEVNKFMLINFDPKKEKQETVITMIDNGGKEELGLREYRAKYCRFEPKNGWIYCPEWKESYIDDTKFELDSDETELDEDDFLLQLENEKINNIKDELTNNIFKLIASKNISIQKTDSSTEDESDEEREDKCFCMSCNIDDKEKYLDEILDSVDIPSLESVDNPKVESVDKNYEVLLD